VRWRGSALFLGISVAPNMWPALVEAAGFEVIRRDGEALIPNLAPLFKRR